MAKDVKELFTDIPFLFKIVELALAITGMAIMIDRPGSGFCQRNNGEVTLFHMALSAYVIIVFVLILTIIMDELSKFVALAFLIIGCILNLAACIVGFINYSNVEKHHSAGNCLILAIFVTILGVVFLIDAIFTFKND